MDYSLLKLVAKIKKLIDISQLSIRVNYSFGGAFNFKQLDSLTSYCNSIEHTLCTMVQTLVCHYLRFDATALSPSHLFLLSSAPQPQTCSGS